MSSDEDETFLSLLKKKRKKDAGNLVESEKKKGEGLEKKVVEPDDENALPIAKLKAKKNEMEVKVRRKEKEDKVEAKKEESDEDSLPIAKLKAKKNDERVAVELEEKEENMEAKASKKSLKRKGVKEETSTFDFHNVHDNDVALKPLKTKKPKQEVKMDSEVEKQLPNTKSKDKPAKSESDSDGVEKSDKNRTTTEKKPKVKRELPTPAVSDPARLFYESMYQEKKQKKKYSALAVKWLLARRLISKEEAEEAEKLAH
uniref:Uncharacterized protein n=1 Tax=Timspurckia oligopyrenoides TaxID=708627 RepID=A0A7S0ZF30_9RHOD|mmetsp:Transcript_2674/g.4713  ORF Transcript_2674/g.4713 Transcript_2674/m.4713 type:complete len:258 (+) Transcript_2674:42-815(+)